MKASIYLVLATLFWSGNFVVGQAAVNTMTPLELTFWRWALAALPLVALAHFVERPDWRAVLGRWRVLLLLSVLGMGGYTLLLYTALQHTSALNASLITAANPALIVVMAIFFLGEKPGAHGWLGIALGLAGVLLVLTRGELHRAFSITFNAGELLMIGAIVVWGFYTIIARRLGLPAIAATAVQVVMATAILSPFALGAGRAVPCDGCRRLVARVHRRLPVPGGVPFLEPRAQDNGAGDGRKLPEPDGRLHCGHHRHHGDSGHPASGHRRPAGHSGRPDGQPAQKAAGVRAA